MDVEPTLEVFSVDQHAFLMSFTYPNAAPEESTFTYTGGNGTSEEEEEARAAIVDVAGPVYSDVGACAWQIPLLIPTLLTAHCYDTTDTTINTLRFIGEGCETVLINGGETVEPGSELLDASLWPYSATYECHKLT